MSTVASLVEKARRCRRLSRAIGDERTILVLTTLANECEAEARAIETTNGPEDAPATQDGGPEPGERH